MSDSGIVPKIFAVAPRHRGTPAARRPWGVSPSARRPEGPRPARSFRIQQERLRFFSCESIRRSIGSFPPFVRCFEVSLRARLQCKPWNATRVRVWLPRFREWLDTFREKKLVPDFAGLSAKSNLYLAKSKLSRSLTQGEQLGYVHPRLIGGDSEQAPKSRETLRLARRRTGLRVRSSNGG
jgi:hypothetical protein